MKHHKSAPHVGRGIALIVATTVCFATLDTLAKLANRYLPVNEIIWGRYVFHGIALTLLMAPKMKWDLVRTAHPGMQILRGVILLISSSFFVSSLVYLPLAEAAAISFVAPLVLETQSRLGQSGPYLAIVHAAGFDRERTAHELALRNTPVEVLPGSGALAFAALRAGANAEARRLYHDGREHFGRVALHYSLRDETRVIADGNIDVERKATAGGGIENVVGAISAALGGAASETAERVLAALEP